MIKPQGELVGLVEVLHSLHVVDFLNQPLVLGQHLVSTCGEYSKAVCVNFRIR
jgi:hypothetical protein